jgi:class 3 adenylate cyclase
VSGVTACPEVAAIARRWLEAVGRQEDLTVRNLISASEHMRYVGSDEGEAFSGSAVRQNYAVHNAEMPRFVPMPESIEGFAAGSAGWAIWQGRLSLDGSEAPRPWRLTFVMTLEHGLWQIVHIHVSRPRPTTEYGSAHTAFNALIAAAQEKDFAFGSEGTATIMFTDIANSTAIAAFLGDRVWAGTVADHFAGVMRLVEEHGGQVVKSLGDGTMSSFASARRAMEAAIAIQRMQEAQAVEPALALRIGLHTGDVVQSADDFFGTVVNTAARITAIAEPGGILVSQAARAMVGGTPGLAFGAAREATLRGIAEMQHLSPLLWAAPAPGD